MFDKMICTAIVILGGIGLLAILHLAPGKIVMPLPIQSYGVYSDTGSTLTSQVTTADLNFLFTRVRNMTKCKGTAPNTFSEIDTIMGGRLIENLADAVQCVRDAK